MASSRRPNKGRGVGRAFHFHSPLPSGVVQNDNGNAFGPYGSNRQAMTMHAVLRRRARCEAAGESSEAVTTQELVEEVRRFRKATDRLRMPTSGNYV